MAKKKSFSPFDLVKRQGENNKQDLFAPSPSVAGKVQPVSQRKLNNPKGNVAGNIAKSRPVNPGNPGNPTNRPQNMNAGAYGQADPGHTQWETPGQVANEGPCYSYNILGQQVPVACDDPNCMAGPCGSTFQDGTGDFYTGGGGQTGGGDSGGDSGSDCTPEYNILGQCIYCCDGNDDSGGGDTGGGTDDGICIYICSDGCSQQQPCNGMPSGTYFTGAECCDGSTPGGDGEDCEPSYNILGQCIACCDGGGSGGDSGGDDSGGDSGGGTGGNCYNILGQQVDCCAGNCMVGPCGEGCEDSGGGGGGGNEGGSDCEPQYNFLGQCIACCDGQGGGSGGGGGGGGSDCEPQYNILGQCIACCG